MQKLVIIALFALVPTIGFAAPPPEPETYAFQYVDSNESCKVEYPRADGMTLTLMIAKPGGDFFASVTKKRWEIVDGQDVNSQSLPMSLDFQDGAKKAVVTTNAKWGGYFNGAAQGLWSGWDKDAQGENSKAQVMQLLQNNSKISVIFQGKKIGLFDMKQKGFAYNILNACLK